jgi:hypothetical protein
MWRASRPERTARRWSEPYCHDRTFAAASLPEPILETWDYGAHRAPSSYRHNALPSLALRCWSLFTPLVVLAVDPLNFWRFYN